MKAVQLDIDGIVHTSVARNQMLSALTDDELSHTLMNHTCTIGDLFREQGAWQAAYIESFKVHRMNYVLPQVDPNSTRTVAQLVAWFSRLDDELLAVLRKQHDSTTMIDAGHTRFSPDIWLMLYREFLLVFLEKLSGYFRCVGKPLIPQVIEWIG
jgi:hypothetical protein